MRNGNASMGCYEKQWIRLPVESLMADVNLVPFWGAVRDKDIDEWSGHLIHISLLYC